jgi:hypothetical protein
MGMRAPKRTCAYFRAVGFSLKWSRAMAGSRALAPAAARVFESSRVGQTLGVPLKAVKSRARNAAFQGRSRQSDWKFTFTLASEAARK